MDDHDITKAPKPTLVDGLVWLGRAGASKLPWPAGPITELLLALASPLGGRMNEWMESIAQRLEELEKEVVGFGKESLATNETFVTTMLHATQIAMRSHQEEKLEALRNAVLNVAISNCPEDDVVGVYLGLVDKLTPSHLRLLIFLNDPNKWKRERGLQIIDWSDLQSHVFSEMPSDSEFHSQVVGDLVSMGLINASRMKRNRSGIYDNIDLSCTTTLFGRRFLQFITGIQH